jgi:hypothetical protein
MSIEGECEQMEQVARMGEKCIPGIGWKTRRKEIAGKIWA